MPHAVRGSASSLVERSRALLDGIPRVWLLFYGLWAFLFTFLHFAANQENPEATLRALTDFEAPKPFQPRVLVPLLGSWLDLAVGRVIGLRSIYRVLDFIACFGTLVTFSRLLRKTTALPNPQFGSLLLLYPMLWNYCVFGRLLYPYDIPAILFFTLGLLAIAERRWHLFYVVFVVGGLNRETICFLTVAYVASAWGKVAFRTLLGHVSLQLALFAGLKLALGWVFAENEGSTVGFLLQRNLTALTSVNIDTARLALAFGLLWVFIPLAWRKLPSFHRRLLWVVPAFVAAMTVFGLLSELRIYSELLPIVTVPAAILLSESLVSRPEAVTESPVRAS